MCQFVSEGRVAAHTEIAEALGAFRPAGEVAALKGAFRALQPDAPAEPEADADPDLADTPDPSVGAAPTSASAVQPTNMLVVMKPAETAAALMQALSGLGTFVEASPGTVLLKTTQRIAKVRTALAAAAIPGDQVILVDAGANRIAWLGLGPELDTALRTLWTEG